MSGTESSEKDEHDLTLDDEENLHSQKKLEHATKGMNLVVAFGFGVEIAVSAISGNIGFFGTVNQIAERYFTKPEATVGLVKDLAESPFGKAFGTALEILGSPPVKRALKIGFSVATFVALGAASSGIIPAVGLGLTVAAVAITSLRDYRSAAKMRKNVEILEKTSELRLEKTKAQSLLKGIDLTPEMQAELNKFLIPEASTVDEKPKGVGIYEILVKATMPKAASEFLLSSYARELKNTIFWNGVECAGAVVTGNFFDVASVLVIGTISENKERTEHRELKEQLKNTIKSDMSKMGLKGKKFRSIKDIDLAVEKQRFFIRKLEEAKKAGLFDKADSKQSATVINSIVNGLDESFKKETEARISREKEEYMKKPLLKRVFSNLSSITNNHIGKHVVGYLNSWNPISVHYNPEKTMHHVRSARKEFNTRVSDTEKLPNISGLTLGTHGHDIKSEKIAQKVEMDLISHSKHIQAEVPIKKETRSRSKSI
jgi:hypothetical protein